MIDNKFVVGLIALFIGAGTGYYIGKQGGMMPGAAKPVVGGMGPHEHALRMGMSRLWSDHVIWTRDYIIAAVADMPDAPVAAARLMKNQEDLGAAIVPFYGQQAGDKLAALLKEHISIAADLIKAAKADDKPVYKTTDEKWHANARDIAAFLSSANPYWPKDALEKMLYDHLAVTTAEVVARLQKNWQEDVKVFDEVFSQALMMAHDLATGIVKQFPDKF